MKKEELLIKVGLNIRRLREGKNISQQDLAAACDFEKSNMSRIEAGRTNFTVGTLLKISNALNITILELLDVE